MARDSVPRKGRRDEPASGGAAGGRQRAASVPGKQGFEGLDGLSGGEVFEQEVQIRAGLEAVGPSGGDEGVKIGAGAGAERIVREVNRPGFSGELRV